MARKQFKFFLNFAGILVFFLFAVQAADFVAAPQSSVSVVTTPEKSTNGVNATVESDPQKVSRDAATAEAIQQLREAAETAAKRQTEALATRLSELEQALATQRERHLEAMQKANRTVLIGIAALVTMGLMGTALMAIFMFRSMNRLVETAASLPARPTLPGSQPHLLGAGEPLALSELPSLEPSSQKLIDAVGQLQRRILELEQAASASSLPNLHSGQNVTTSSSSARPLIDAAVSQKTSNRAADSNRGDALLENGTALLNQGQIPAALACFDELIMLRPDHAEAHLKRGAALEKAERFEEALSSFSKSLELDASLVTAHLCKAGLFQKLERHEEALKSYQAALQANSGSRSNVVSSAR